MRKKEADSNDFYDNDDVRQLAFQCDFERSKLKTLFGKVRKTRSTTENTASKLKAEAEQRLAKLRTVLIKYYAMIVDIFVSYCSQDIVDAFSLSWNSFRDLITDCKIVNKSGNLPVGNCGQSWPMVENHSQ